MADISVAIGQESLRIAEQLIVPTRVYFPSSGTADLSPTFDALWVETAAAVRRELVVNGVKRGTAAASVTVTSTATNPEKHLHAQYVSPPLRAQTIAGNIRGQFRGLESNAAYNGTLNYGIRVVDKAGTVVATLLAVGGSTTTATTPPEFATSLTNRRLLTSGDATPIALTSYTCKEGDRLVIEIGSADKDAGAARTCGISFGDNTVDLPENDTTTTAQDPWIEFDSTIQFLTAADTVRISDGGTTQMQNQGWIKITDSVSAAIPVGGDLNRNLGDAENIKISQPISASRDIEGTPSESLKIAETLAQFLANQITLGPESLKLSETATVLLNPEEATPSESLRIAESLTVFLGLSAVISESLKVVDAGLGRTELIGFLRLQDGPPIAFIAGPADLTTSVAVETLKQADTLAASRDVDATPSESLKISESLTAVADAVVSLTESLKIAETSSLTLDPLEDTSSESLKISDTASGNIGLLANPSEALRIADSASGTLDPEAAIPSESLKISESLTAQITFTANLSEAIRIADSLSTTIDPIQNSASEALRIQDIPSTLIQLGVLVADENVHVTDRVVILAVGLAELFRIKDVGFGQTGLLGTIRIQDGPVQAQVGGFIGAAPSEALRIAESLTVIRDPLESGVLQETLKLGIGPGSEAELVKDEWLSLQETVSAALGAESELFTSLTELFAITDGSPVLARTLEQIAAEALILADSLTASRGLTTSTPAEAGKLADSLTAARDVEATIQDAGRLVDSVTAQLETEAASASDSLKIADTVGADRLEGASDLSTSLQVETLKLSDTATASRTIEATPSEALTLADTVTAEGPALVPTALTEALRLSDGAPEHTYTPLDVEADEEDARIGEQITAVLAVPATVPPDSLKLSDSDFQIALDLSTDTSGGSVIISTTYLTGSSQTTITLTGSNETRITFTGTVSP